MYVNRSAPARIHAIPSRARARESEGKKDGEGGVDAVQGGGRSCGALRWIDGGDGGGEKAKTGRQRGIRSEKEGGGKAKRHKAQNRDNVTNEIQFCFIRPTAAGNRSRDRGMPAWGGGGLSQKLRIPVKPVSPSPSSSQNTVINAGLLCKRQRSSKARERQCDKWMTHGGNRQGG